VGDREAPWRGGAVAVPSRIGRAIVPPEKNKQNEVRAGKDDGLPSHGIQKRSGRQNSLGI
jgi:hypothetical protein